MKFKLLIVCFLIGVFSSCSSVPVAIKRDYNFDAIRVVGVTNFGETNAGTTVRDEFIRQFVLHGLDVKVVPFSTNSDVTLSNARNLGVDILVEGSVSQFMPEKKYFIYLGEEAQQKVVISFPTVTEVGGSNVYSGGKPFGVEGNSQIVLTGATVGIAARMVDIKTGEVVWAHGINYEGLDIQSALRGVVSYMLQTLKKVWTILES